MKAVTRQRPKNANYSVSANPTHSNGVPLNTKSRTRVPDKLSQPQQVKQIEKKTKIKIDENEGKMTKFRSLDDIPDFTDDFGKDKHELHENDELPRYEANSPIHYTPTHPHNSPPKKSGGYYSKDAEKRPSPKVSKAPPPLPAEGNSKYNKSPVSNERPPPQMRSSAPPPVYDDNSCDSVDTDFSDDDDIDCNNSYLSSTDDYNVDYTPGKASQNKGRVVKSVRPVQKSYPTKKLPHSYDSDHNYQDRRAKEQKEITYKYGCCTKLYNRKPYTLSLLYRAFLLFCLHQ